MMVQSAMDSVRTRIWFKLQQLLQKEASLLCIITPNIMDVSMIFLNSDNQKA